MFRHAPEQNFDVSVATSLNVFPHTTKKQHAYFRLLCLRRRGYPSTRRSYNDSSSSHAVHALIEETTSADLSSSCTAPPFAIRTCFPM
ncbi:hypothetical protein TNCV_552771 [Trichonephila clavipes]|nr:hypothetical protein TNCV_552771 [Trichonephila clavipes]